MNLRGHEFPELRIVDMDKVRLHEQVGDDRLKPLVKAIEQDGVLINPPAVLPFDEVNENFVVLDGANRTTVLRKLKLPHALMQVVRPERDEVALETWNQVVVGGSPSDLLMAVEHAPGLALYATPGLGDFKSPENSNHLAILSLPGGKSWSVVGGDQTLKGRVVGLGTLMASCSRVGRLERSNKVKNGRMDITYPEMSGWVAVRPFTIDDVVAIANDGFCLPAGITRFVIAPRALRVHYPLRKLSSSETLEQKQMALDDWVQRRIQGRHVRFYAESTYMYDE